MLRASSTVQRKTNLSRTPKQSAVSVRSFQDLEAWQVCREIRKRMSALAKALPAREKFLLADQMIRASRSTTASLAEGYGRYQYPDMIHFPRQTRGSLYELLDHLTVALDEGYILPQQFEKEAAEIRRALQVVNGFIRFLRQRQQATKD